MLGRMYGNLCRGGAFAALFLLAWLPQHVAAVPIVSVDLDPATVGVQSVLTVAPGDSFQVDIVVNGVPPSSVNAFEFSLEFSSAELSMSSVALGTFFDPLPTIRNSVPIGPVTSVPKATDPSVSVLTYFDAVLGGVSSLEEGILASITFEVLAAGASALKLDAVELTGFLGALTPPPTLANATVTVAADPTVPVPASGLLLALGLAGLMASRRRPQ